MQLTVQRRLAADILKCSPKRVLFDETQLQTIKEAITKQDVRSLISSGAIMEKPVRATSRVRARATKVQKSKGRQKGQGSRKGKLNARGNLKTSWINRVRLQRAFVGDLKAKGMISVQDYHMLRDKIKGGFFRNKRHIKLFVDERGLIQKK